ncbi:hypothetical protein Q75_12930 [Bacillus coahuilensis p1.1.43]|uniref:Uncharacterized protein n=1 Tax=Bacillus coahuilensis p1.1.43 TaxID=1150625 RepID=A0A147K5S4_9BACI|nr:hypothetical protein Q75_12930 [Bacillus coahuilensis p1.1.43]
MREKAKMRHAVAEARHPNPQKCDEETRVVGSASTMNENNGGVRHALAIARHPPPGNCEEETRASPPTENKAILQKSIKLWNRAKKRSCKSGSVSLLIQFS